MKRSFMTAPKCIFFLICFFVMNESFSQGPPFKFNYQMVVRNANNDLVVNSPVGIKISMLKTSAAGPEVFVETHTPTTNSNGLATIVIGGGTLVSGFLFTDLSSDQFFIKTDVDPTGGTNYSISNTTQILDVPQSYFSKIANTSISTLGLSIEGVNGDVLTNNGTRWVASASPWIKNGTSLYLNKAALSVNQLGIGITPPSLPNNFMDVADNTSGRSILCAYQQNATGTVDEAAIKGYNQATDGNGAGVLGRHLGTGYGVYGVSNTTSAGGIGVKGICKGNGAGVFGEAATGTSGNGVYGVADFGAGLYGTSNSGTGCDGISTTAAGVRGRGNTGVWAEANTTANSVALKVVGAVKAEGANKFAYRTSVASVAVGEFTLTHSNQAATDIIILTPVHNVETNTTMPGYFLYWNGTAWKIYNASDDGTPSLFPAGTAFNVIVIRL